MGSLNESVILKKLENLQPSQENIETLSLWCLHHKDSHQSIVQIWMKVFRAATSKHRLPLIYLANDVCQREKQKKFDMFRKSFSTVLREAFSLCKTDDIRANVERIVDIWKEREIFDASFINELKFLLQPSGVVSHDMKNDNEKWLAEFKLDALIAELEKQKCEKQALLRAQGMLPTVPFNADGNIKSYFKDRQEGLKYVKEIDMAQKKMSDFVVEFETQLQGQSRLMSLLEQAKVFYETQLAEAGIVETAYRKFGGGIKLVKQELDKMKASGLFPTNESPPRDAPSPTPTDDPFAQGVEAVVAGKQRPSDRMEPVDMELDEDERLVPVASTSKSTKTSLDSKLEDLKFAMNRTFMPTAANGRDTNSATKSNVVKDASIPPPANWNASDPTKQMYPHNAWNKHAPPPMIGMHPQMTTYVYDHKSKQQSPPSFDVTSPPPRIATNATPSTPSFNIPLPSMRFPPPPPPAAYPNSGPPLNNLPFPAPPPPQFLDKNFDAGNVRGINQKNLTVLSGTARGKPANHPYVPQQYRQGMR